MKQNGSVMTLPGSSCYRQMRWTGLISMTPATLRTSWSESTCLRKNPG